jgi:DNA sulfur modification protein DndC
LEEICDDAMQFELIARLLDTERQYQTMSRRKGVIEALEKPFDTSSRSRDEAMDYARRRRRVQQAATSGEVDTIKQFFAPEEADQPESPDQAQTAETPTWGAMKFGARR